MVFAAGAGNVDGIASGNRGGRPGGRFGFGGGQLGGEVGDLGVNGQDGYEELFHKADRALYHVKRNGKNDFAFYTPEMEQTAYQYQGHSQDALWQSSRFDGQALSHLLIAVSALYPLVISANLTQNSYYMMQYDNYTTKACFDAGRFDDLVNGGAETFHPEDRESFHRAFDRENLLAAYQRGQTVVSHVGRQRGDDGVYRTMRTDSILVKDQDSDDIMQITMARELDLTGLNHADA